MGLSTLICPISTRSSTHHQSPCCVLVLSFPVWRLASRDPSFHDLCVSSLTRVTCTADPPSFPWLRPYCADFRPQRRIAYCRNFYYHWWNLWIFSPEWVLSTSCVVLRFWIRLCLRHRIAEIQLSSFSAFHCPLRNVVSIFVDMLEEFRRLLYLWTRPLKHCLPSCCPYCSCSP